MSPPVPLNQATLAHHGQRVAIPRYDRSVLRHGVVHLSVGSFHRAHQAVYFDELAQGGLGDGWALTGVGLHRRAMAQALAPQDGLYTVLARSGVSDRPRVVGIITRYLFAPAGARSVLAALTDAGTRLVTLTVTAAGYRTDAVIDEGGDAAGLSASRTPGAHALELIVEALDRRRRLGRPPFTVLSCDNLPGNGAVAREATLAMAGGRGESLRAWIAAHTAFPSSMVDRITPGTTDADRELIAREFGIRDRWPVVTEQFSEWVIEDAFCNGRPPLEEVGVRFVSDVTPYTTMKTRMLNGTHCALGYLGVLAGHDCVSDALGHPVMSAYVRRLMDEEIAPLLRDPPRDPLVYASSVRSRLANPAISDPLSRLCRNGSMKVPAHLLSAITDARRCGSPHRLLTLGVAAWCRYLRGGCAGAPQRLEDPEGERLRRLARSGGGDPRRLLADERTFGALGRDPAFVERIARDLLALDSQKVHGAILARMGESGLSTARAA